MKFPIMAENYPPFCRDLADPFVVRRFFIEVKFVFRVVMIFNRETVWLRRADGFW
jgi:hypothetical protein